MLYGSLAGDALALGPHWIYDQAELEEKFGRVSRFRDPQPGSYHPKKVAGELTHYGDQALVLMESISRRGGFTAEGFAEDWRASWAGYGDYVDKATKATLAKMESGAGMLASASESDDLGGAARLAPLLVAYANRPLAEAVAAARAQTAMTHGAPMAQDAAEFITRVVFGALRGLSLEEALAEGGAGEYVELRVDELWAKVREVEGMETRAAAEAIGQACPAPQALPLVVLLLRKHGESLAPALIENVMCGGDNAARGLVLGLILGAMYGRPGVPGVWQEELKCASRLQKFLQGLQA